MEIQAVLKVAETLDGPWEDVPAVARRDSSPHLSVRSVSAPYQMSTTGAASSAMGKVSVPVRTHFVSHGCSKI